MVTLYHNCTHIHKVRECLCACAVYICLLYANFRAEVQKRLHQDQDYPCEVVGSWNTWYGEQDQSGKQQIDDNQKTQ